MSLLFWLWSEAGVFYWLDGKRIIILFLINGDIIIALLAFIARTNYKRWVRVRGK